MTDGKFDSLTDVQKEYAEMHVRNAVDGRIDTQPKTKKEIAEELGVTDRTLRNWMKNEVFLEYIAYLSRLQLQAAMPDFVGVLISNLSKGQNLSTKQLDLIAKVADWVPDKASGPTTMNVQLNGIDDIEKRIQQLEARKQAVVIEPSRKRIEAEEAVYVESE